MIGRITGDGNPFDAWGNGNYAVNVPHAMSVVDKSTQIDSVVYCADTSNEGHLGDPVSHPRQCEDAGHRGGQSRTSPITC